MPAPEHITSLKHRHADIDDRINQEEHRPQPDENRLRQLKRQKLKLKDAIASLERT